MTFTNIACDILPRRAPYAAKSIRLNIFAFLPSPSLPLSLLFSGSKRANTIRCVALARPTVDISTPADHERTRPGLHSNGDRGIIPLDGWIARFVSSRLIVSYEASGDGIIWKVTLRPRWTDSSREKMEKVFSISFLLSFLSPPLFRSTEESEDAGRRRVLLQLFDELQE